MSSCGLSHAGLRATCAAADAGRAFLDPVPHSWEPRGGASDAAPGGPLGSLSIRSRGGRRITGHRAGTHCCPPGPVAPATCLTHTCFVCLTVTWPRHLIQAAATTTPQPPDTRKPFLCPRPASHTLSAPPSRPLAQAQGCPPTLLHRRSVSGPFPLPQLHSFNTRSLNTLQLPGSIPGAEDPVGRSKKRNRRTSLLSWHLPSDREINNRIDN